MQKRFTDLMVQNLTLNKLQDADTIMDMQCRGLGLRITPEGRKRWLMVTRFPGSTSPARRTLGEFPSMGLADARAKADLWRTWIGQGKDPKIEEERQRAQELRRQSATFGAVAEAFFADIKRRGLRRTTRPKGKYAASSTIYGNAR